MTQGVSFQGKMHTDQPTARELFKATVSKRSNYTGERQNLSLVLATIPAVAKAFQARQRRSLC